VKHGLALLGALGTATATTAHAEHAAKEVTQVGATATALAKALLAVLIVELALLGVRENFVSRVELLELLLVATSVRVVLQSQLPESILDIVRRGIIVQT
jgi:hypothetical protein